MTANRNFLLEVRFHGTWHFLKYGLAHAHAYAPCPGIPHPPILNTRVTLCGVAWTSRSHPDSHEAPPGTQKREACGSSQYCGRVEEPSRISPYTAKFFSRSSVGRREPHNTKVPALLRKLPQGQRKAGTLLRKLTQPRVKKSAYVSTTCAGRLGCCPFPPPASPLALLPRRPCLRRVCVCVCAQRPGGGTGAGGRRTRASSLWRTARGGRTPSRRGSASPSRADAARCRAPRRGSA